LFNCRIAWLAGLVETPEGAGAVVRTIRKREGGALVDETYWQ
jgi:hypothetical protein